MRIAVTYENGNGQVYQHFGHTEKFKLYDVDGGKILSTNVIDAAGSGHRALGSFLVGQGVDAVICGGIGVGMQEVLMQESILVYGGVTGDADEAVKAYLENRLSFNPNVTCVGHDGEEAHGEGSCGCGHHHEQEHAEGGCGCGHHHEQEHTEGGCGCGHHHEQEHAEGGCGCGRHAEG